MDYTLLDKESKYLEAIYRDLSEHKGLTKDDKEFMQDILEVLNRRGWRIKL